LALSERYRESVRLLTSIPGIGVLIAMELLTELGEVARFRRADKLSAYVGLTPAQYSSGDRIRLGHITRSGKAALRSLLVEAAWVAVRRDCRPGSGPGRLSASSSARAANERSWGSRGPGLDPGLLVAARAVLITAEPYRLVKAA
jgi:transposase